MVKLTEIIAKIKEENITSDKDIIVAFKGFPYDELEKIDNKFFYEFQKIIINKNNIEELRGQLLPQLIQNVSSNAKSFWMTYEELILSYEMIRSNFKVIIVNNNLYNKKYPFDGTIDAIETVYQEIYLEVEKENSSLTHTQTLISEFYGEITYSKVSERYYITYNDAGVEANEIINLYSSEGVNIQFVNPNENLEKVQLIELTDDETIFLDVCDQLLNNANPPKELRIITMLEPSELPNNYLSRIEVLQSLLKDKTVIRFTKKALKSSIINNLSDYKTILENYWGYNSFKDLDMYIDVQGKNKELTKISQAQIIDDIVEQSSLALKGEDYRDIYITSATGSGKSIMFQIPAVYMSEKYKEDNPLTLIISPLIGLMNDQVNSLKKKGIITARAIHSNIAPYERDKIINDIANGKVNMLYLSPETLQNRFDIKTLIGDRRLGLVIIDEAHIVTTWGKSFRADYWYLGLHLQRLRKQYRFPIVTFTATAIYGGREDMYLETRDSLNMINPISYFGNVKRNDIYMCIKSSDVEIENYKREFTQIKNNLTMVHLEKALQRKQKTLVYFPTIKLINQFKTFIEKNNSEIDNLTGLYHGKLSKEEKDETLDKFTSGEQQFVLATKAFGMGIDIPDITHVYHYTPTGTVTDYIQEVGRVARDNDKVSFGYAWLDFLEKDFNEVNKLYGMGKISNAQLVEVMQKIFNLYRKKGNDRNLIVSADDFYHIFNDDGRREDDNVDNKLKTALLLIEKNFELPSEIGFPPFIARPRAIYGQERIFVTDSLESRFLNSPLKRYLTLDTYLSNSKYKAVYNVNLSLLWEEHYRDMSFSQFKYKLYTLEERKDLKHANYFDEFIFVTGISFTNLDKNAINDAISEYNSMLSVFEKFLAERRRRGENFEIDYLGNYLMQNSQISNRLKARSIAHAFINNCFEFQNIKNTQCIREIPTSNRSQYRLFNYDRYINFLKNNFSNFLRNKENYFEDDSVSIRYYFRSKSKSNSQFNADIISLGFAEAIDLLSYNVENGTSPQIYIRVNSITPIERAVKSGRYYNRLLHEMKLKHYTSVEMLTYLFKYQAEGNTPSEKVLNYTDFFWESIENYFLGVIPSEVEEELYRQRESRRSNINT